MAGIETGEGKIVLRFYDVVDLIAKLKEAIP